MTIDINNRPPEKETGAEQAGQAGQNDGVESRPGEAEFLASYNMADYPPVAVTVDIVTLTIRNGELCVLLVQRGDHPYKGWWALPGGFATRDETLDESAAREYQEETGVDLSVGGHIEQLGTYGDPGRDPRGHVVSVAYLAFTPELAASAPRGGSDAEWARWWPVRELNLGDGTWGAGDDGVDLAFDHQKILRDGLERAAAKLEYTTLAATFCEEPFTIGELQRVYEAVWNQELQRANFRRKILSTQGFVVEAEGRRSGGRGHAAQLYRRGPAKELYPPMTRTSQ